MNQRQQAANKSRFEELPVATVLFFYLSRCNCPVDVVAFSLIFVLRVECGYRFTYSWAFFHCIFGSLMLAQLLPVPGAHSFQC